MTDPQSEEAAMRQAFEQFMITGKTTTTTTTTTSTGSTKKKRSTHKKTIPTTPPNNTNRTSHGNDGEKGSSSSHYGRESITTEPYHPPPHQKDEYDNLLQQQQQRKHLQIWKVHEQKAWQIIQAFQGTLQRHWLDVDDNLGTVLSSIAHLRHCLYIESQYITRRRNHKNKNNKNKMQDWWKLEHENDEHESSLHLQDVQLAFDYDLQQHEKMMAGTRTLLASLSDTQDTLGRRLEELFLLVQDVEDLSSYDDTHDTDGKDGTTTKENVVVRTSWKNIQTSLSCMNDLFVMLAMELHRKQCLVQSVLESFTDDAIFGVVPLWEHENNETDNHDYPHTTTTTTRTRKNDDTDQGSQTTHAQQVANHANREWSRQSSRHSAIDMVMLQTVLELGKKKTNERE